MNKPYVQSNFERRPDDDYPTIDTRCVDGLIKCYGADDPIVDVCGKNGSAIVDYLKKLGRNAFCVSDAFKESFEARYIVTNPPYKRPLVDQIIERQLERVSANYVNGLAILVRSNFDFAKGRRDIFSRSDYWGQIKLCFRPWWTEARDQEPIHNYVWHIWRNYGTDLPTIRYYYAPYDERYAVKTKAKSS